MTDKIKSCPFCGGEAKVYDGQVVCTNCWSGSACENTTEKAITIWNTRKPMDRIVEQLEKLKAKPMELAYDVPLIDSVIEIVKAGGKNED